MTMTIDNSDLDGAKQVVTRAVEKYNLDPVSYTHLTLPTSDLV